MSAITDQELAADLAYRREHKNDYDGEAYTANLRAIKAIEAELARRAARMNSHKSQARPMSAETAAALTEWEKENGWTTD